MRSLLIFAAVLTLSLPGAAHAQKKPTPPRKPGAATKPVQKPSTGGVAGAAMLPGDNGKLNQQYTMGAGTDYPYVFNLLGAEYSRGRLVMGDQCFAPTREQKLLVLRFTIHNPNKRELLVRFDTVRMVAVDSKDVNHEWIGNIAKVGEYKQTYDAQLKPAQKIELVSAIVVPADVSVPKLMVHHPQDKRVLRYDMRGVIKPLPAPYADPSDTTGATALVDVPAQIGQFYPAAELDLQVDGTSFASENLGEVELGEGKRFLVVQITFRNSTNNKHLVRFDTIDAQLKTPDGDKVSKTNYLLKPTRNESADQQLDPGETYSGRIVFEIPKDVAPGKLSIWQGESHHLVYNLSNVN